MCKKSTLKTKLLFVAVLMLWVGYWLGQYWATRPAVPRLIMLNIGQGDSLAIESEERIWGLIDGGPDRSVVAQLGKYLPPGSRLEFVLATHSDSDHISGLADVLEQYKVGRLFYTQAGKKNSITTRLVKAAVAHRVPIFELRANNDFRIGCCLNFDVIWPHPDRDLSEITDTNAISTTAILSYGTTDVWLGGDLGTPDEEEAWKTSGRTGGMEILKAGHHGSKNSSSDAFLDMITPQWALISAGLHNKYGHPAPRTMNSLKQHGVRTVDTAHCDNVEVDFYPQRYEIKSKCGLEKSP